MMQAIANSRVNVKWLMGLIFVLALLIRMWDLNAIGNVWDEYFYYDAMREYVRNVVRRDLDPNAWRSNKEHPPVGKYVYAPAIVFNKLKKVGDRDAYHAPRVISAVIGSLTVALVFLIGTEFFSLRTGLMASLIYGLLPPVISYHKIINLDVTMVFFFSLSLYFFLRWIQASKISDLWWSMIFAALSIATKFNAALIILIFFGTLLIGQWRTIRQTGTMSLPLPLLVLPILTGLVLITIWPWLWSNTLDHFLQTLAHWGGTISEQFLGRYGPAPVGYFIIHFLLGTPAVVLILLAVGLYGLLRAKLSPVGLALIGWLVAPFGISFYHLRQDHLRYILSAYPGVALIASIGFWWLIDRWFTTPRFVKPLLVVLVAGYLSLVVYKIHPYYLNYYNELVGGAKGVAARELFDLGFYGEGIKEATEYVNQVAEEGAIVHFEIIPDDAPYLDRPRLIRYDAIRDQERGFDYLIINQNALKEPSKKRRLEMPGLKKVYTVKAAQAEFVWVYRRIKN